MKAKGSHPDKALSAVKVRSLADPGRHADGNGLYLEVDPSGAKRWLLRVMVRGRRRDIGLGSLKLVSLAEAREKAAELRKLARSGGDPLAERRRQRVGVPTFEEAAKTVHETHKATWKNSKHISQWINSLTEYAFPKLGNRRVDQIETPDVLAVLSPIWLTRPETARRVRQRIGTVMDWAGAAGHRTGPNPVLGVGKGLPKQPDRVTHHAAMPYADIPTFVKALRKTDATEASRLAFEFLILTAARTGEVIGATWAEIDLKQKLWIIPASRMKAKREHRVPLSERCLEVLRQAKELNGGDSYVFAGRSDGKALSNMAFLMMLRRMQIAYTVHGFRSSFRDWASERSTFPTEVCEMALAHSVADRVEAAYRRGDLLDKRRKLMASWASFVLAKSAEVIPLRAG